MSLIISKSQNRHNFLSKVLTADCIAPMISICPLSVTYIVTVLNRLYYTVGFEKDEVVKRALFYAKNILSNLEQLFKGTLL